MKNQRAAILLLAMGILALIIGIIDLKRQNTYLSAEAVITRIDMEQEWVDDELQTTYSPWVQYSVDGVEYEGELGYYENGYQEGKTITIKYSPDDPTKIIGDAKGFDIILLILGPAFVLGAAFLFLRNKILAPA